MDSVDSDVIGIDIDDDVIDIPKNKKYADGTSVIVLHASLLECLLKVGTRARN